MAHHHHPVPDQLLLPVAPGRTERVELDRCHVGAVFDQKAIEAFVTLNPPASDGPFENDGDVVPPVEELTEPSA